MFRFLNKISKGLVLSYCFKITNKRYLFGNYQHTRLFSSQFNQIDDLLSKVTLAEKEEDATTLIDLYKKLGLFYIEKGDLNQSIVYFEKAVKILENKFGLSHPNLRAEYLKLGDLHRVSKSPKKSIEWYEKALKIEQNVFGKQSKEVASTLTDLIPLYNINADKEKAEQALISASAYMETQLDSYDTKVAHYFLHSGIHYGVKNNRRRAIEDFKKCKKILENKLGHFTIEIAMVNKLIAMDYWKIGDLRESERYFQDAINIGERLKIYDIDVYIKFALLYKEIGDKNAIEEIINKAAAAITYMHGIDSLELVKFYVFLIQNFNAANEHETSRKLYEKSLIAIQKVPDQAALEVATYYEVLSDVANKYSEFDKVIDCTQRALKIKHNFGMAQKNFIQNWIILGHAFFTKNDYEKSEKYTLQALEILDQENSDKEKILLCLNTLAKIFEVQKRFSECEAARIEIIMLRSQISGKIHSDVAAEHASLGILYKSWGKIEKGIESMMKAIEINAQALGNNNNVPNSEYLLILAEMFGELRELEKKVKAYELAIDMRNALVGKKDPEIGTICQLLARTYSDMGKFDKALEYFEKGLQKDLENYGDKDDHVGRSYLLIGDLYEKIGNKNAAIDYFQKSLPIFANNPTKSDRIRLKILELSGKA